MNIRFDGQLALVTGGTRGIGKQIALDLEGLGARVILTGSSKEKPEFLTHGNFSYISSDFTNDSDIRTFLESLTQFDRIDICVNNAGINKLNYIENVEDADYDAMMKVNIDAPYKIVRTIAPIMKKNKYGRIINISSIFGKLSKEKRSAYTVTKYAIKGLTVASSIELAQFGVLVNTVSPGFTLTDLTRKNLSPEEMERLCAAIPMHRMAEVKEISNVVLFLASSLNTYITGQDIIVDGGFTNV